MALVLCLVSLRCNTEANEFKGSCVTAASEVRGIGGGSNVVSLLVVGPLDAVGVVVVVKMWGELDLDPKIT